MKKEINPKIDETIDVIEGNEVIKKFLKVLLDFEHEHSEQIFPRYKEFYDLQIKKYAEMWWNK